jgi:hypothetical protein
MRKGLLRSTLVAMAGIVAGTYAITFQAMPAGAASCSDRADDIRDRAVTLSSDDHDAAADAFVRSANAHLACSHVGNDDYGAQIDAAAADFDNAYDERRDCHYIYRERLLLKHALTITTSGSGILDFDRKSFRQRLEMRSGECL